jgi:hypothetical protein
MITEEIQEVLPSFLPPKCSRVCDWRVAKPCTCLGDVKATEREREREREREMEREKEREREWERDQSKLSLRLAIWTRKSMSRRLEKSFEKTVTMSESVCTCKRPFK